MEVKGENDLETYSFHVEIVQYTTLTQYSGGSRGRQSPMGGVPTYNLANFSWKLHENKEILAPRGVALTPPGSTTALHDYHRRDISCEPMVQAGMNDNFRGFKECQ